MNQLPAAAPTAADAPTVTPSGFVGGVWHPEDLLYLDGTPWIVVSAMRSMRGKGALLMINATTKAPASEIPWDAAAESGRRAASAFDPHGIDVRALDRGRFELIVVDHGAGEAIDRLILDTNGAWPVIVAGSRVEQPEGTSGNAVAFVPGGGFVMTSMFDPRDPDTLAKFAEGRSTGGVWRWDEQHRWRRLGPDLSGANGIAVSSDGATIFVSEWSGGCVWKWSIDGEILGRVDVDFLPDNLRWTAEGALLLAGQVDRPERVFGCEARGEPCPLAFAVVRLDPDAMALTTLVRASQDQAVAMGFGGATGAIRVGPEIWVGSFTGERIALYECGA